MHSTKRENLTSQNSPSDLKKWILASRPKTWIASLSPVFIGSIMASKIAWILFALTALFSMLIQIGTNFANDYYDFVNGADTKIRLGPKRAVLEGWIDPKAMKMAAFGVFITAAILSIPLMIQAGPWSLFVVIAAIASGVFYTKGPKPLGYLGLGELFVLFFFGPVACCGSYFLQTKEISFDVFLASLGPGLFSCALLAINNLRDEKTDSLAKKNTLVVRFGSLFGKIEFALCLIIPLLVAPILVLFFDGPINLIGVFFLFPIAIRLIRSAFSFICPSELIPVLQGTALLFIFYTILFIVSYLW